MEIVLCIIFENKLLMMMMNKEGEGTDPPPPPPLSPPEPGSVVIWGVFDHIPPLSPPANLYQLPHMSLLPTTVMTEIASQSQTN